MTRRRARPARPASPRSREPGAFARAAGTRISPRTSPSLPRARVSVRKRGFTLRSKIRLSVLTSGFLALILFRLFPEQTRGFMTTQGTPGVVAVVAGICSPVWLALLSHWRSRRPS